MNKNSRFLSALAACAALATGTPAWAVDLTSTVKNANMETQGGVGGGPLADGQDNYPTNGGTTILDGWRTWADSNNGTNLRIWNPSAVDRSSTGTNQFFDISWGGVAPQGNQVIAVRTQALDYTSVGGVPVDDYGNRTWTVSSSNSVTAGDPYVAGQFNWNTDSGGIRNFEAAAQLTTEMFDPTAKYTLSVKVGRLQEGDPMTYDNSGFNAGFVTAPAANSTRFVNNAPVLYNGYFVNLIAGGVTGGGASFQGWTYGRETNNTDVAYMKVLGTENSLGLAQNTWGTSTQTYLPGSLTAQEVTDLTGKKLMVRLAANEAPDHKNTTAVAFDDVQLFKFVAGDANEDDMVNGTDLALLAASFGGAGNWATGDFSGDGTVNGTDLALMAANFGFDGTMPSASFGISLEEANDMLNAVPEPATWTLLGSMGLAMLGWRRLRNRK